MIFEAKTYTPGEYEPLLLALYMANGEDLDNEIEFYESKVSHLNPDFAQHVKATLKSSTFQKIALQERPSYFSEFEATILEALAFQPVDLPNYILSDRRLKRFMGNAVHNIVHNTSVQNDFETLLEGTFTKLPQHKRLVFLNWFLHGLNTNLENHKGRCSKPGGNCETEKSYEYRISVIQTLIEKESTKPATEAAPTETELGEIAKKIQWLGTQKQLAELFVELKKKGWIEKIEGKTIKACFTDSDSVSQYLKPATDKRTKEDTYENLYNGYSPIFYGIKENLNNTK